VNDLHDVAALTLYSPTAGTRLAIRETAESGARVRTDHEDVEGLTGDRLYFARDIYALNPVETPVGVQVAPANDGHDQQDHDNGPNRDSTPDPTRTAPFATAAFGSAFIVYGIAERE
jgi:hypothetical protein